jgi:hypothetical protein
MIPVWAGPLNALSARTIATKLPGLNFANAPLAGNRTKTVPVTI